MGHLIFAFILFAASASFNIYRTVFAYPSLSFWWLLGDVLVSSVAPIIYLRLVRGGQ